MRKFIILSVALFILNSCNIKHYSDAVKEDTERIFKSNKAFIHNLSINGFVTERNYYKDNTYNKYILRIKVLNISDSPSFSQLQYPPYYSFVNDSLIDISVSEFIYNNSHIGSRIDKNIKSNNIIIDNTKFQLLSNNEGVWLP